MTSRKKPPEAFIDAYLTTIAWTPQRHCTRDALCEYCVETICREWNSTDDDGYLWRAAQDDFLKRAVLALRSALQPNEEIDAEASAENWALEHAIEIIRGLA